MTHELLGSMEICGCVAEREKKKKRKYILNSSLSRLEKVCEKKNNGIRINMGQTGIVTTFSLYISEVVVQLE